MRLFSRNTYFGWFVVAGAVIVAFGMAGGEFYFGVLLKPMTEEFGW